MESEEERSLNDASNDQVLPSCGVSSVDGQQLKMASLQPIC
jgi:hypothetical protein